MQELGMRAGVLLFSAKLGDQLWSEAMHHGNCLRNRLPAEHISGNIPILAWNPKIRIQFKHLPKFGQQGFAFVYTSDTVSNKKLKARSVHGMFVVWKAMRTYSGYTSNQPRRQDFKVLASCFDNLLKPCTTSQLPVISSFLDGLYRQSLLESDSKGQGFAEEILCQAFQTYRVPLCNTFKSLGAKQDRKGPNLPRSFHQAIMFPKWRQAIDREFNSLLNRNTWVYIDRTSMMKTVPFTWVFRLKPLDNEGFQNLYKAHCVVRGYLQTPDIDFDPIIYMLL